MTTWKERDVQTASTASKDDQPNTSSSAELSSCHWTCKKHGQLLSTSPACKGRSYSSNRQGTSWMPGSSDFQVGGWQRRDSRRRTH